MPRTQMTPKQRQFLADLLAGGDVDATIVKTNPSETPAPHLSASPIRRPAVLPGPPNRKPWLDRFIRWLFG